MATQIQITIDCAHPAQLAQFWAQALGYKIQDAPEGYDSWQDWLQKTGVPESEWDSASAIVDPDQQGPRIYFQRVPEAKAVKNRVHLDLNINKSGNQESAEARIEHLNNEVTRLKALGAHELYRYDLRGDYWITLADPEGNEFCIQ
ncbi:VOC family protein [Dictyobacter arantiisoli]|uniref:Glyoxalase n=1 Tax=Dictyobacter arantiisoli TaxID=2014874 RepID=A0A5A5TJW5_9CHLR|nr:VOC family protein [Dictyobacter arantiisoli]GCF11313.1 glyoxalase [Dictyobacter arantiisoli]